MQVWLYQHFPGMGSKDAWAGYQENQYPRAMLFKPLSGLGTPYNYINHLDALDLTRVIMAPYGEHREARQFEWVNLYSGWLRYGDRMVRYLPKREVLDAQAAQEDGEVGYLELSGRMSRIRDHVYDVMSSSVVPRGSEE